MRGLQDFFQFHDALAQTLDLDRDRVRQIDLIQILCGALAVALDNGAGNTDDRTAGRHFLEYHRACADLDIITNLERTQDLCTAADDHAIADGRMPLSGILAGAAEGDSVKTAASGKVVKVEDDELMGTTVVIEHAGGYSTQYSCLQKDPPVTVGQEVAAGDVIGQVGSTASAEAEMGAHLHFSVSKDGKVIDPSEYVGD